ncbi:hypothetical protein CRUP_029590, partial [Coryphaenoides rupestris]
HSVAAKTGGCFPGDGQVLLEGGATKRLRDILPGDRVLASSSADGGSPLLFSPVLSFLDRQPGAVRTFYVIRTAAGLNITLTAAHLIYISDGNCTDAAAATAVTAVTAVAAAASSGPGRSGGLGGPRTVFASKVRPGQCVLTPSPRHGKAAAVATLSRVTSMGLRRSRGLYAPLTLHGSLVVDGVLASCYAAVDQPGLAHRALAPLRLIYGLLGPSGPQADGLHWYPWVLQRLGRLLLDPGHFHPLGMEG